MMSEFLRNHGDVAVDFFIRYNRLRPKPYHQPFTLPKEVENWRETDTKPFEGDHVTQRDVAEFFKISPERVRQIERRALYRLRSFEALREFWEE